MHFCSGQQKFLNHYNMQKLDEKKFIMEEKLMTIEDIFVRIMNLLLAIQ